MRLRSTAPFLKFDSALPIYNWIYPLQRTSHGPVRPAVDRREINSRDVSRVTSRALYFHVPFCETICSFCPFVRGRYESDHLLEQYVRALVREIIIRGRDPAVT